MNWIVEIFDKFEPTTAFLILTVAALFYMVKQSDTSHNKDMSRVMKHLDEVTEVNRTLLSSNKDVTETNKNLVDVINKFTNEIIPTIKMIREATR